MSSETLDGSKRPASWYKEATDNNPNIIVSLVAYGHRALHVWADPHNESFYIPPLSHATDGCPPEGDVNPEKGKRARTPDSEDPSRVMTREPGLQITFSKKPKNPELGYLLGSNRELCDIFLGYTADCISEQMFSILFNRHNEVIMKSWSTNPTVVTYGGKIAKRTVFTWIFPSNQKKIFVNFANTIMFAVVVPTHETDKAVYEANCRDFMKLAESASHTLNLSSRPNTSIASGAKISHAAVEPPFYLLTARIGKGGFGVVHKARSMPNGSTVAFKRFKSKNAWTMELDVLRKISKTPHDHIVQFIDFGLGDEPFLVMGLALGGNLEEQSKIKPFTFLETILILYQMLEALVYLHNGFQMTHRDIKPANILCDSRAHYRLADFGVAKEGDLLKTFNGTQPYMAPEMFTNKPYTTAVDLWALGMVVVWLLRPGWPPGYRGNEGLRWCAAVAAHFKKYEEACSRVIGSSAPEQIGLNFLVGRHMLKIKPEERQSAVGCLDRGEFLWYMLDQTSHGGAKALIRENQTESFPDISHTDNESEAETEVLGGRTPNTEEWLELERQFPNNEVGVGGSKGRVDGPQHYVYAPSIDPSSSVPEDSVAPGSNGHSDPNLPHQDSGTKVRKRPSLGSRPTPPAASMRVRKSVHTRNSLALSRSNVEQVTALAAQQADVE